MRRARFPAKFAYEKPNRAVLDLRTFVLVLLFVPSQLHCFDSSV
jgi:hypothetical protein